MMGHFIGYREIILKAKAKQFGTWRGKILKQEERIMQNF